jgi:RNA polymerase sigma factor (sigma-70 family)
MLGHHPSGVNGLPRRCPSLQRVSYHTPIQESEHYTFGLLERYRNGDRAAATELLSAQGERLRKAIRARLPREARYIVEEDEILQETVCRALQNLPRFEWRGKGAFLAWLVGIAVNTLREEAARVGQRGALRGSSSGGTGVLDNVPETDSRTPSRIVERLEDRRFLEDALDRLDEEERVLIIRRQILEQDYPTLAEDLGITEGAVRTRVSRAMSKLARWVERSV